MLLWKDGTGLVDLRHVEPLLVSELSHRLVYVRDFDAAALDDVFRREPVVDFLLQQLVRVNLQQSRECAIFFALLPFSLLRRFLWLFWLGIRGRIGVWCRDFLLAGLFRLLDLRCLWLVALEPDIAFELVPLVDVGERRGNDGLFWLISLIHSNF